MKNGLFDKKFWTDCFEQTDPMLVQIINIPAGVFARSKVPSTMCLLFAKCLHVALDKLLSSGREIFNVC